MTVRYEINERQLFKVGMYLRLSQEDKIKRDTESNSIENQRKIITNYIDKSEELVLIGEYVDDGYTGTDFKRPAFQKMLDDIQNRKIDTIIVKDLSRFGRNYIEVGKFLEDTFPTYKIRFISIIDNIDSFKDPESSSSILVNFKNLINDEYARDISRKTKSSLSTRQKKGDYVAPSVPFGYKRDELNKYKLVVDKEAAYIVKLIFELAKNHTPVYIVDYLNERKIPTPAQYRKHKNISFKSYKVNDNTVNELKYTIRILSRILTNEVYTGTTIQNKTNKMSYKLKKINRVEKDKWIKVENTHEALVSKEDFDYIQDKYYSKIIKVRSNQNYSLFSGYLICNDCRRGFHFIKGKPRKDGSRLNYYICGFYNINKNNCTPHLIHEDLLKTIILKAINKQIKLVTNLDEKVRIITNNKRTSLKVDVLTNQKKSLEENINKNMKLKQELYTDWKNEIISFQDYLDYSKNYSSEIEKDKVALSIINDELKNIDDIPNYDNRLFELFSNKELISDLNRDILLTFIDVIKISEDCKIEIIFKFSDIYKNINKYVKDNKDFL